MTARQFFGAIFLVLFVGCWAGGIGTWFQMLRHSRSRNGIAWTARELTPTGSRFWKQWWMLWIAALVTGALSMLLLSGV